MTSAGAPPQSVGDGRYQLLEVRGQGGMAIVWRARDTLLERDVAVKLLRPEWAAHAEVRERFRREALAAARLRHAGVVSVLDAGADDAAGTREYLVMEYVDGPSLAERLAGAHVLHPAQAAAIGAGVARALAHAHEHGITHRDVKPGNILLDVNGPRLTDFGIAKSASTTDLTGLGSIVGTAAYLAPEQADGGPIDGRTDQYALGCVLFECVTGERPFTGQSPVQVAAARLGARVRPSERAIDVPPQLDAVIARAMTPEREGRFADAATMAAELEAVAAELATAATTRLPAATPAPAPASPAFAAALAPEVAAAAPPVASPPPGFTSAPLAASPQEFASAPSTLGAAATAPHRPTATAQSDERAAAPPAGYGTDTGQGATAVFEAPPVPRRRRRRSPLPWVLVGVALLGLAAALFLNAARGSVEPPAAAAPPSAPPSPSPSPTPDSDAAVTPAAATSFDPQGDGAESESEVGLLLDGDPATAWTTEGYDSAEFGNLKEGVGVAVDLGASQQVAAVRLTGASAGTSLELRTAATAPTGLEETELVASATGGDAVTLQPDAPVSAQHLLVWITAPLPADGGRFRATIAELEVLTADATGPSTQGSG